MTIEEKDRRTDRFEVSGRDEAGRKVPGLNVLRVDASGRTRSSTTRALLDHLVRALDESHDGISVTVRDVSRGIPFVDAAWIEANFTDESEREAHHRAALALSDALVAEIEAADVVAIGVPIYNFGVPASLKAWVDMVARARRTFRYTANGPEGLLKGKKAILFVASGGVPVGGASDFATPYLRHALAFLGITDVAVVDAGRQNAVGEVAVAQAKRRIDEMARRPRAFAVAA